MDISPTPEFQEAFRRVTGLECTPGNVIPLMRSDDSKARALIARVAEENVRLVCAKEGLKPDGTILSAG
jgi:hypothetical protein